MFEIIDRKFAVNEYGSEEYLSDWPIVYILENGGEAYIGESSNVLQRMYQHGNNEKMKRFKNVHFIYSDEFNQSATFDYEAQLIQLFSADEKFKLINGNGGLADKEYYKKEYYDDKFHKLWKELKNKKLVEHEIDEIKNSELFKYSPYKALNGDQKKAVYEILWNIKNDCQQPVIVNGMPGSGKTIVAIFLLKRIRDIVEFNYKKIALVIPQTSLRTTLKKIFKNIYGLKSSDVIGPYEVFEKDYDILLVDEAHKLHRRKNIVNQASHKAINEEYGFAPDADQMDWILARCICPVLFYDAMQVVGPSGITVETMNQKIKTDMLIAWSDIINC